MYKFVIPSINRSTIIKIKTLALLKRHSISPKDIFIYCVGGDILDYYKELHGEGYNIIHGKKGIAEQRNFISSTFKAGAKLITIDDDVVDIYYKFNDKKVLPIPNLMSVVEDMFKTLDKENATCCGIYPIKNPFYMKEGYSTNLKFCIGQFRCFYNIKTIETSRTFSLLEDYEMSLKHYLHAGKIIRYNHICVKADYIGALPGGLSSIMNRSYLAKKKEVEEFYHSFSVYCFIKDRETNQGKKIDIGFKEKAGALNIWNNI